MSKILKEISCIVGKYTNKDGEEKNRYQRIGSIIETRTGSMLKLDVIPLKEGGWDGWAYLNDPRPRDEQEQPRANKHRGAHAMYAPDDDQMPF
jgi:hypothetical protein